MFIFFNMLCGKQGLMMMEDGIDSIVITWEGIRVGKRKNAKQKLLLRINFIQ